jgi:Cu(I)/Ag(I) efflux system membrane fusion protein
MTESTFPSRGLIVAGLALLLSGIGGGYWAAKHLGTAETAAGTPSRKVLYWHDPMVPTVKFEKPGKSPFMDMQLVPVYADEAGSDSGVRVSANTIQSLGIRKAKVENAAVHRKLTAVGSVAFNENLLEVVPARVEGYVTRLFVRAPLETVRRGQPLAEIQAPAWLEAQQEYLALLDAESETGRSLRSAARDRLRVLGVPEATVRRIEVQRKTAGTTTIVSPIDGVLSELGLREGAAFMPGAPLFRINGLASVWANARIPEAQLSLVSIGSEIVATAAAWPGVAFKGKVIALLPELDAVTRTSTARIELDNKEGKLVPGMFVSLDIAAPAMGEQLLVPSEAVITTGERNVAIVANADGSFGVADVIVGSEQDGRIIILEGLSEGQSIVVSGQFLIDSEASLKSAVSRLEASPPITDPMAGTAGRAVAHSTQGTITAIDEKTITLDHEAVPALNWPPMTMGFVLPEGGLPKDLKVGDRATFAFTAVEGGYRIVSITENTP